MSRKIVITSCRECPHKEHSGQFTPGGAIPLCGAIKNKGQRVGKYPNQYCSVLPFTGGLVKETPVRVPTYVIPDWCPLPEDKP